MRMMKFKFIFLLTLVLTVMAQAQISLVYNGSFEYDGENISDVNELPAYAWFDVNGIDNRFNAGVVDNWSTHGRYYLTMSTDSFTNYSAGEMVKVSQQVYLTDVNELSFDIAFSTDPGSADWDPALRSAVVLIDDQIVWNSNNLEGSDLSGVYLNQTCPIPAEFNDANEHKLSLGLKVNSSGFPYIVYIVDWDFIKFDTYCGGTGYLPYDFNRDCFVDIYDMADLANAWLIEGANTLSYVWADSASLVDVEEFAIYAGDYGKTSYWLYEDQPYWDEMPVPYEDLDASGSLDLPDIAEFAQSYLSDQQWLKADFDRSGLVDLIDFALLTQKWQKVNWIHDPNE